MQNNKVLSAVDHNMKVSALKTLNSIRFHTKGSCENNLAVLHSLRWLLESKHECFKEFSKEEIVNIIKRYL